MKVLSGIIILISICVVGAGCSSSDAASSAKAKVSHQETSLSFGEGLKLKSQLAAECTSTEDQYTATVIEKIDGQERMFQVVVPKFTGPGIYKTGKGIGPASVSVADTANDGALWSTMYNDKAFEIVIEAGGKSGSIEGVVMKTSPKDKANPSGSITVSGHWACKAK